MNTYIFYTTEGYTETPRLEEIENLQILGEVTAENSPQALDKLLHEVSPWILSEGYDLGKIVCRQVVDKDLRANIQTVIDYLWADEERHYEECTFDGEDCEDHIFLVLKALKNALGDSSD